MSILDLNKNDFHYNYIMTKYGGNANLLFTDTDSLAYEIRTKDFYKDINLDNEKRFNISDYPTNHLLGSKTGLNSQVLEMFKDEAGGKQIVEFVALRAKLYSYKCLMALKVKHVRVSKNITKRSIKFYSCLAGRNNIEK